MTDNTLLRKKTFDFAVEIIRICDGLPKDEDGYNFYADQVKRAGTLIGALVVHLDYEPNQTALLAKIKETLKEVSETAYWIDLLNNTGVLEHEKSVLLQTALAEIKTLLDERGSSGMFN